MAREDTMELKVKDGKIDLESLEVNIRKKLPGYHDFKFDFEGNKAFVTARKTDTPKGKVELFVFSFFHNKAQETLKERRSHGNQRANI